VHNARNFSLGGVRPNSFANLKFLELFLKKVKRGKTGGERASAQALRLIGEHFVKKSFCIASGILKKTANLYLEHC